MLMRTCIEVEANLKAILTENGYSSGSNLTMKDYCKVEASHLLSEYKILIPYWHGQRQIRTPFEAWATGGKLPWYQAYNAAKHDRHVSFSKATFDHLI